MAVRNSSWSCPTDAAVATVVAEGLRRRIARDPFPIQQGARTVGVAIRSGLPRSAATTMPRASSRADQTSHKRDGRNRVVPDAA
jgi:two-component system cell cycle response regulator